MRWHSLEERLVPRFREGLERLDADDAVDGLVELLPAAQEDLAGTAGVDLVQQLLAEGGLVLAQGQADDVDVVALDRALHHRTPTAADVKQRHPRL